MTFDAIFLVILLHENNPFYPKQTLFLKDEINSKNQKNKADKMI